MDTKQFLSTVLGGDGHYCVVGIKDGKTVQKFYDSVPALAQTAADLDSNGYDTYFALSTFADAKRKASNVVQVKALFLDLDCGEGKPYPTQHDALIALRDFYKHYELPAPTSVVNSGRGLHVYWALPKPCTKDEWLPVAERLKSACAEFGLEADQVVTADAARILRVPDTHNYKTEPPTPVRFLRNTEKLIDLEDFASKLPTELIPVLSNRKLSAQDAEDMRRATGADQLDKYEWKFLKITQTSLNGGGCKQIRRAYVEPDSVSYEQWLHVLSIAKHCVEPEAIHVISSRYSGYDPEETEKVAASIEKPHFCATFEESCPEGCEGCPYKGKIKSPISLCKEIKEAESNQVEVPVEDVDTQEPTPKSDGEGQDEQPQKPATKIIDIPAYPEPYFRGVNGGVYRRFVGDKDEVQEEVIYEYDLYITKRMIDPDPSVGPCYEVTHHTPREGIKRFMLTSAHLSSNEEFKKQMARNEIFLMSKSGGGNKVMHYVAKWIEKLRVETDAIHVRTQFGWVGDDHKSFVLGPYEISANEITVNPPGSRTAQYFSYFKKRGTLEGWKEVVDFYGQPGFEEHQYMFGIGFGSPLMEMVPNITGSVFHLVSSETGHGKTTGMWGGASIWGDHKRLVLKGKDTPNSAWNRAEMWKNLPLYIDELSNWSGDDLSDFLYAVSDGEQRNRLSNKGQNEERYRGEQWGLTVGSSANISILQKISADTRAFPKGEAGRVIEAKVRQLLFGSEGAIAGNTLNDKLAANYGHAGPIYIQYVIRNYEKVADMVEGIRTTITREAKLEAQHRHWSAQAATIYVGLLIAKKLGLIKWDLDNLYGWIIRKLNSEKSALQEMNVDIHELMAEFYNDNVRSILRLDNSGDMSPEMLNILGPDSTPSHNLVGRHEYSSGIFYFRPSVFKTWCSRKGYHYDSLLELIYDSAEGRKTKLRLGKGTKFVTNPQHVIEMRWVVNDEVNAN